MENDADSVAQKTIGLNEYKDTSEEEDPCEKCPEKQFYPNCDSNFPCPFKAGIDEDGDEELPETEASWQYRENKDASPETTSYKPEEKAAEEEQQDEDLLAIED